MMMPLVRVEVGWSTSTGKLRKKKKPSTLKHYSQHRTYRAERMASVKALDVDALPGWHEAHDAIHSVPQYRRQSNKGKWLFFFFFFFWFWMVLRSPVPVHRVWFVRRREVGGECSFFSSHLRI